MSRWRVAGAGLACVVMAVGQPAAAHGQDGEGIVPARQSVVLERADRSRARGSADAPIRIVEISDFQCPYCAQFYRESYGAIDSIYVRPGTVRYVWISYPSSGHPRAWPAIESAFCAGAAGRFWEMHDLLFERQDLWIGTSDPDSVFRSWGTEIGLDAASFADCLRNDLPAPLQVRDYESALRAGVTSTPFFIIGDSVAVRGAVPLDTFRSAVDSVLALRGIEIP